MVKIWRTTLFLTEKHEIFMKAGVAYVIQYDRNVGLIVRVVTVSELVG